MRRLLLALLLAPLLAVTWSADAAPARAQAPVSNLANTSWTYVVH